MLGMKILIGIAVFTICLVLAGYFFVAYVADDISPISVSIRPKEGPGANDTNTLGDAISTFNNTLNTINNIINMLSNPPELGYQQSPK